MYSAQEELIPKEDDRRPDGVRQRDPTQEKRERIRFDILRNVYERCWAEGDTPVRALDVGLAMGLSREEIFRTVLDLTQRSYLSFCAAGPQVCITEKGIAYLQKGAGRRHSIREP
jgi:hypothetical protein